MGELLGYSLIRSRRRTLSVEVKNKKIIVRAPLFLGRRHIEKFLEAKSAWIKTHLKLSPPKDLGKKFADGEEFIVLGKKYQLKLILSSKKGINPVRERDRRIRQGLEIFSDRVKVSDGNIIVKAADLNPKYVRKLIENFYISVLRGEVETICARYKDEFGIAGRRILLKFYRSKWGSCSAKNCLSFNAKLAQAPKEVIEYVVVHELAHLKIKNHSRNFWATVSRFCPDYKSSRAYLNKKLHMYEI